MTLVLISAPLKQLPLASRRRYSVDYLTLAAQPRAVRRRLRLLGCSGLLDRVFLVVSLVTRSAR
jgi:hypothetical protein